METSANEHEHHSTTVLLPVGNDMSMVDLPTLAASANRHHADCQHAYCGAIEAAWRAGQALLAAKAQCQHGQWLPWLEANFAGSQQCASNYMRIAANYQSSSNLDSSQSIDSALKAISKAKNPDGQRSGRERKPEPRPERVDDSADQAPHDGAVADEGDSPELVHDGVPVDTAAIAPQAESQAQIRPFTGDGSPAERFSWHFEQERREATDLICAVVEALIRIDANGLADKYDPDMAPAGEAIGIGKIDAAIASLERLKAAWVAHGLGALHA